MTRIPAGDHAALHAACRDGVGLCTVVNIEGSFSRRTGAQLAVAPDGSVTGSLADGCLESQLAAEVLAGGQRRVTRFGAGSSLIDFRLPCGSGLDVLIDPAPDHAAARKACETLERREPARLTLPEPMLPERLYVPRLRLQLFGEGPELDALALMGEAAGHAVEVYSKDGTSLSLGQRPKQIGSDEWSAVVLLFHDHEWEQAILEWAIDTPAFFIGAQGGQPAREERLARLSASGASDEALGRITSPIGAVRRSREPVALALSVLAQVTGEYEARHPHG